MRKSAITLAVILALGVTVTGCTTKKQEEASAPQTMEQTSSQSRPGQFSMPDMMGEISAVDGKEITIKEIEMPQFRGNRGPGESDGNRSLRPERGQDLQRAQQQQPDRKQDEQGAQGQQRQPGERGPQGEGGPRAPREIKYTGETKKVTIPDGVSVTQMTFGENGPEQKVIEMKDLKAGDVLSISYSDKEKGIISSISVRPAGESRQQIKDSAN